MAQYLEPIVASVSPNLYAAAKSANLGDTEVTQVNQMSYTIKQHRELVKLDKEVARKKYDSLDPGIQDQLKFMFKNADYLQPPASVADKVQGVLGAAFKVAASPLIGLFKLGGAYNRVINEPYLVGRQVAQGADLFSKKTWTNAWDGKNLYDNGALVEAKKYFGDMDVLVARGLLEGKTPGEIVMAYGKADEGILASIQKAYNEPDKFKDVMDGVKYAQISPGRDIARMLDNKPTKNGGIVGDYIDGRTKNVSGVLDFVYQIAVDPLTWMTGGLSKGVTKGERLANSIVEQTQKGISTERAVSDAFKDPQLFNLWEKGIGPELKNFSEAKNAGEKSAVMDRIAKNFPGYNNPEVIQTLTTKDVHLPNGVVDAASAQKFFGNAQNLHLLLAGRVDGVTYMRNGVAIARTHRLFHDGLTRFLDNTFNGVARDGLSREDALKPIHEALLKNEDMVQRLKNPSADTQVLRDAMAEIKMWKNGRFNPKFIGKMASRSAMGLEVRTGEGAIKTAANFTARARQILPKDMAQALTYKFLESTADEQYVLLRNLDAATMYSMGLGGDVRGEDFITKVLQEKYAGESGFATKKELAVNPEHAKVISGTAIKQTETGIVANSEGPIHFYQSTGAVGSLPYEEIGNLVWDIRSKRNAINAVGGATQGAYAKKLVNAWSILTLFPRLGIRSAIDEATMYVLTAPGRDLRMFAMRQGNKMGNIARAFTGSKESTGPIKQGIQKIFKIGNKDRTALDLWGKRIEITPEEALTLLERDAILQRKADEMGVEVGLLKSIEKREAIGDHIRNLYGDYIPSKDLGYLLEAFVHQPDALNSMATSIIAHSALSGKYGEQVMKSIITPSMLDLAFEELGVKMGRGKQLWSTAKLSESEVALAHFEKWFKMFAGNKFKIKSADGVEKTILNPTDIFFKHNGLKPGEFVPGTTKQTFEQALDDAMEAVGFKYDASIKKWKVENPTLVDAVLAKSSHTVSKRQDGLSEAQIVRDQFSRMFLDMYETFHGDANKFNEGLMTMVQDKYRELARLGLDTGRVPSWNQAVAKTSLGNFTDATQGYRISGEINSEIAFGEFNAENVFQRWGNEAMDAMDRQVTGIFRQPAVMVTYVNIRKKYAGIQKQWEAQYIKNKLGPFANTLGTKAMDDLRVEAAFYAQKRFSEIAAREAADTILKYADNPQIRSNFAFSARTVGRYYRATEDFYRRIYRMKDVSPRVLYRMRLVHLGLDANGMVHTDANGEPYVIMPMDTVIFKATDNVIRTLTGRGGYSQPSFSEFTLKLRMMNPSFSQDSGLPTLSGPVAGLSVVGFKNILGTVPGKIPFIGKYLEAPAKQLGESIDTFALGNIGDNMDVTKAIVPASLQRVWAMLPVNEQTRQEVTAAQQAIAYNAAHGIQLDPNASAEVKNEYLKNIRISAHNIIFLRNFLGLIGPVAPTLMESKGVPDYVKDTGIVGLRAEFFDILNGISKTEGSDVQDPYELALATYIGKNPGKLIYTVSREDKQQSVLVQSTNELKTWAINNKGLIDTYGETAYIFAPKTGNFNAATYNWMQAAGLFKSKTLENYYDDLLVAEDKQRYYDIARNEKKQLAEMSDPELRANLIAEAENGRAALKAANPLLEQALIGQGNNIGGEQLMLTNLDEMISNPKTPIDADTRSRMSLAIKMMQDYIAFCEDPELKNVKNNTVIKEERKAQIESDLRELMMGNAYLTEANRAIFRSILNFYSRDSYYAFRAVR